MSQDRTKLRWNGWGLQARQDTLAGREDVWSFLASELGMPALLATPPRPLSELSLPPSRLGLPERVELSSIVGTTQLRDSLEERAFHARGRLYRDLLQLRAGDLSAAPDAVLYPRGPEEVVAILALAAERDLAVVPFGGGTALRSTARGAFNALLCLDLSEMDRVTAIDTLANTATVEAGIYGPALETALKAKGLTLGYAPQDFEFTSLGGWIAGAMDHRAPQRWLAGVTLATPGGLIDTTSADLLAMITGTEGRLGVVTSATLRLQPAPAISETRAYLFRDFASGLAAVRACAQEGCGGVRVQLYDGDETRFLIAFDRLERKPDLRTRFFEQLAKWRGFIAKPCLMVAYFDGDRDSVGFQRKRLAAIARRFDVLGLGQAEAFRQSRFAAPYIRESLLDRGVGAASYTAIASWSKLGAVYEASRAALERVIGETAPRAGARGLVFGRVSPHSSDSATLTLTAIFPRAIGADLEQDDKISAAAALAIRVNGAVLLPHHSEAAAAARTALKNALDPKGILVPPAL